MPHSPPMLPSNWENLQIEPTKAKVPLSGMTVCALEVRAASLGVGRDIPTPAALVGYQREVIVVGDLLDEGRVGLDGTKTVGHREGRATERGESLGYGLLCRGEVQGGEGYRGISHGCS